jgi:predicted Zn-dependent peptidase
MPTEPLAPLTEPVREERVEDVPNDRLHLAFRLPVDDTPEFFASALALDALAGLATSRLYQRLVRREQVATNVSAHAMGLVDGVSLGFIGIDVAEGTSADDVEATAMAELERFGDDGPTAVEMESALADSERSWLSALASQEERADLISHHALLQGDADYVNTYLDRLAEITPEQVRDAARRWLQPRSAAVVAYLTTSTEGVSR